MLTSQPIHYPLSADPGTLERQVAGIALDLKNSNTLQRGIRVWHDDAWMSPDDYFAEMQISKGMNNIS